MEWLEKFAPGFAHLPMEEKKAIFEFSLLCSLFEAKVMPHVGVTADVRQSVTRWAEEGVLDAPQFDEIIAYFRARYFVNESWTHHFNSLKVKKADLSLVKNVLNHSDDPIDRVVVIVLIIWRFRNNLFHGAKWEGDLRDQRDNFRYANRILRFLLEQHVDWNA